MPTWLIWLIVIVIVVVVVAAVMAGARKRRTEQRRNQAGELREQASTQAGGLTESQRQADELRAKADLAKAEAQRAEEHAAQAEQGHQVEQASYEDKLRTADQLDPDVNTRSKEYEPDVWNDGRSASGTTTEGEGSTETAASTGSEPRHVAEGDGTATESTTPTTATGASEDSAAAQQPERRTTE